MKSFIPYGKQWIDEEDIQRVVDVLRSDYLTTGPMIPEFERKIAEYTGAKHVVAISNGTAALHAACFAADIKKGDEVITTPITFAASANAVLYCGGTPIFADIDPVKYNIDPVDIERKITDKTKAIIPVHYTGQPCDMDPIIEIAKKYNLKIIEDGAHALGARYKGSMIGTIGDMTTFSFHPVKPITTGEGGAIATNDTKLYERLKMFITHGITRDQEKLIFDDSPWYYEQHCLGYNYRLTDIQAALGVSQMNRLGEFIEKRSEYAGYYTEALAGQDGIITPKQLDDTESGWHIYVIQLELEKLNVGRKEIFEELRKEGLGVNVHYVPVYYHPYYRELGYQKGICPNAEWLYERMITIPLFPRMALKDVEFVINTVKKVIQKHLK